MILSFQIQNCGGLIPVSYTHLVKYTEAGNTISISNTSGRLQITNPSSQSDAATLNALLQSQQVNSKASGFGLQIANDLANAINAKILFERSNDTHLTAALSWNL